MPNFHVQLRFFASLREGLGISELALDTSATNVGELRQALVARGGAYAELLAPGRAVRAAVNQVMADENHPLAEGCEVAFFPPVTGG